MKLLFTSWYCTCEEKKYDIYVDEALPIPDMYTGCLDEAIQYVLKSGNTGMHRSGPVFGLKQCNGCANMIPTSWTSNWCDDCNAVP